MAALVHLVTEVLHPAAKMANLILDEEQAEVSDPGDLPEMADLLREVDVGASLLLEVGEGANPPDGTDGGGGFQRLLQNIARRLNDHLVENGLEAGGETTAGVDLVGERVGALDEDLDDLACVLKGTGRLHVAHGVALDVDVLGLLA